MGDGLRISFSSQAVQAAINVDARMQASVLAMRESVTRHKRLMEAFFPTPAVIRAITEKRISEGITVEQAARAMRGGADAKVNIQHAGANDRRLAFLLFGSSSNLLGKKRPCQTP